MRWQTFVRFKNTLAELLGHDGLLDRAFGAVPLDQALAARKRLWTNLLGSGPVSGVPVPWLRGIGVERDRDGSYVLVVMALPIDDAVDVAVPLTFEGVPVLIEGLVGDPRIAI
jgi:hypothetical protein